MQIILEYLFNRITLQSNNARKNKANNYTFARQLTGGNAEYENGVRLDCWVVLLWLMSINS